VGVTEHVALASEPNARQWHFSLLETVKEDEAVRVAVTMWAIWHSKRKSVHEEVFQISMATMAFINRFMCDVEASKPVARKTQGQRPRSEWTVRWIAPSQGRVKVNVDAAVAKSSAKGAVGAVCRSFEGLYRGASAMVYEGVTSPGILEALACREGLDVADDLGVDAIQVASDCLDVVKGLQGVNLGEYGSILTEIQARASSRGDTTFGHERREHNVEAHNLARFASSLPEGRYVWFLEPPIDIPTNVTRDV
jgi:ribonuclease HI